MKKIIIVFALIFSSLILAQEISSDASKKVQIGIHYVGNLKNENLISDEFNGIFGIDGRYSLINDETLNFYGGLTIDYLKNKNRILKKDAIVVNPKAAVTITVLR